MKDEEKAQIFVKIQMPNGLLLEYEGATPERIAKEVHRLLVQVHEEDPDTSGCARVSA